MNTTDQHRTKDRSACALANCIVVAMAAASVSYASEKADAQLIERGRYLVKITGCNDCHTPRYLPSAGRVSESIWLTGDRLGWQGPWGTTYPPNLRLLVQGLSADQWLKVARRQTRPPMPWFALREMTDQDLIAIFHFIRSLGPTGSAAPAFVPPGVAVAPPVVKIPGPNVPSQKEMRDGPSPAR
jgi:mono/diheme cytochrome c family protein